MSRTSAANSRTKPGPRQIAPKKAALVKQQKLNKVRMDAAPHAILYCLALDKEKYSLEVWEILDCR